MKVVLYTPHRQVDKIINELKNNNKVICISTNVLWKIIPLKSKYKLKFKLITLLLNLLRPSLIITCNWISKYDAFYSLWTKKNKDCKFVVVQHGGYIGGVVTVNSHKYIRSDIFLTWGKHYQQHFKELNSKKAVDIVDFGNTLFNGINRNEFKYSTKELKNVLIVNSGVTQEGLIKLNILIDWLQNKDYIVDVKLHVHQERKFGDLNLRNVNRVSGSGYDILKTNKYDVFIVDHSSFMLDAIFFKKKVLFFPQYDRGAIFYKNVYSEFLKPIEVIESLKSQNLNDLNTLVNIEAQEDLFNNLISVKKNNLTFPFDL